MNNTLPRVRVLLADDHTMLREGLRRCLEADGFEVVGEACDGLEAIRMVEELTPDVVLMDVSMPAVDGVEATRVLRQRVPQTQIVILTMHADEDVVLRAVRAGAAGYLVKDCTPDELLDTLRRVTSGESALSPHLAAFMLHEARSPAAAAGITRREEEVLRLIAEGASTTEVAERLFISAKTVKNHLASIYSKLDSRDRTQAVLCAARMGIIRIA